MDKLATKFYRRLKHVLPPVISELFELSIREGSFPTCLNVGRVIPIFKSGKKIPTEKL